MSTITRFRAVVSPFDLMGLSWLLGPEIRIEERLDGDHYIVRAELPGVKPADVQVSLAGDEAVDRWRGVRTVHVSSSA